MNEAFVVRYEHHRLALWIDLEKLYDGPFMKDPETLPCCDCDASTCLLLTLRSASSYERLLEVE